MAGEGPAVSARTPATAMLIGAFAALLLFACLSLVTAQHRSRTLFVEYGRLQAQAKELEADGNRLRIELGKAAQPAAVAAAARSLGLRPTETRQTIFLPAAAPSDLAAAASEVRR